MKVVRETSLQARQQKNGADKQFTGMPRSIRTRLLNPRKKAPNSKGSAQAVVPEIQQDLAVNSSGRMALGPWLGPYMPSFPAAEPGSPLSPTLYVKYSGRVFGDLEGSPVVGDGTTDNLLTSNMVADGVLPINPTHQKDHSKELFMMNKKGEGKGRTAAKAAPKLSVGLRRARMLNQPRSGF